jgi:SPP1 family predicted phage head-tail adaptor
VKVPGIRAGDLRRQITIQQRDATVDSFKQEVVTWTTFATCWAEIDPMSGRELMAAGAQQFEMTHEITIRYRAGVTPAMRVLYQGRIFNIVAVIDNDTQHRKLTLVCQEGLTQG